MSKQSAHPTILPLPVMLEEMWDTLNAVIITTQGYIWKAPRVVTPDAEGVTFTSIVQSRPVDRLRSVMSQAAFAALAPSYGLQATDWCRPFTFKNEWWVIVGIHLKGRGFSVVIRRTDGCWGQIKAADVVPLLDATGRAPVPPPPSAARPARALTVTSLRRLLAEIRKHVKDIANPQGYRFKIRAGAIKRGKADLEVRLSVSKPRRAHIEKARPKPKTARHLNPHDRDATAGAPLEPIGR